MHDAPLSRAEIKQIYDEIGAWQDTQGFYEQPAKADLIAHAEFESAGCVAEVGCGTGRFAEILLEEHLPPDACYRGLELSTTMVALSRRRLERFGDRVSVRQTDGAPPFNVKKDAADRFVANYVLDLLPAGDIRAMLDEAHRLLRSGGRLCLASLTHGATPLTRLVSRMWTRLHAVAPACVGGCRPVDLGEHLNSDQWAITHRNVISAWGVSSEVVVARPR